MKKKYAFKKILGEEEIRLCIINHLAKIQSRLNTTDLNRMCTEELLLCYSDAKDLDRALGLLLENQTTVDLEVKAIQPFVKRQQQINHDEPRVKLDIYCELEIYNITIPDPQKDEIVLSVLLHTGVSTKTLKKYFIFNELCSKKDFSRYEKNWDRADTNIDMEERERFLLEKVLRLELLEGFNKEVTYICYNFNEPDFDPENNAGTDPMLWRACAFSTSIRMPMDYKDYPFDFHNLSFYLVSPDSFDVSDQHLIPHRDSNARSLMIKNMGTPRSMKVKNYSPTLLDVATITRVDVWPESMIRFDIGFSRITNTFFWHTLIPSGITILLSVMATGFVFWGELDVRPEVLTQVLPAVLISITALQLLASQNVPPNSGHTVQDNLFIVYYLLLLVLYLSLQFHSSPISFGLFAISCLVFLVSLICFIVRIKKNFK